MWGEPFSRTVIIVGEQPPPALSPEKKGGGKGKELLYGKVKARNVGSQGRARQRTTKKPDVNHG